MWKVFDMVSNLLFYDRNFSFSWGCFSCMRRHWYPRGHLGRNLFLVTSNGLETPQGHFKTSNKPSGKIRALLSINFWIFSKIFTFHDFHAIFMLFWTNFRNIWLIKIISTSLIHCVMIWICSNMILEYFEIKNRAPARGNRPPAHGNRAPDHKNRASVPWKLNVWDIGNIHYIKSDFFITKFSTHETVQPPMETARPPMETVSPPMETVSPPKQAEYFFYW